LTPAIASTIDRRIKKNIGLESIRQIDQKINYLSQVGTVVHSIERLGVTALIAKRVSSLANSRKFVSQKSAP